MLWRLQNVNILVPTALRGRGWFSREVAPVLNRKHRGPKWTERNPRDGGLGRKVEEK